MEERFKFVKVKNVDYNKIPWGFSKVKDKLLLDTETRKLYIDEIDIESAIAYGIEIEE